MKVHETSDDTRTVIESTFGFRYSLRAAVQRVLLQKVGHQLLQVATDRDDAVMIVVRMQAL